MYCYFSASCSHPPTLVTSLHLAALLKKLCELSPSETCVCVCSFCYWQMLIKFYIACTAIFQPVTASPQSCWHIFTWQCFKLSWKSSVSYPCLRLLCFFFAIDRCWLNFILHVLLFFSQLQPPPNPSDSLIPASDYSEEPKWVMFACILFYVAIIMFNNFGHVPFFSMTGKILSQGNLLTKLYHIQDNAFTANLLDHYWQICKSISSLKSFERMCIAPNVGLAALQLHKTFGTLIMDIYPNECEVCMSWGEFNMWFVGT